jgi:predicted DNA-binding transcriptional regulator YafY
MSHNEPLIRQLKIMEILSTSKHGLSVRQLHEKLEEEGTNISLRTARRLIYALISSGLPIQEVSTPESKEARFLLKPASSAVHNLTFSHKEVLALWLARGFVNRLPASAISKDLDSAFDKLNAVLGERPKETLSNLGTTVGFDSAPRASALPDPAIFDLLREACTSHRKLRMLYASANSNTTRERDVGPYGLQFVDGAFYLLAECMDDHKVKTFAVPRIKKATILDEPFSSAPVAPDQWFTNSFGAFRGTASQRVRLIFASHLSGYIRDRQWHSTQTIKDLDDGRVELSMNVDITPDLRRWVWGFRNDVEIVEGEFEA